MAFQGWAMDIIDKIHPPSSKGHNFIIVATKYFTKWVEAQQMKKVQQSDVVEFIEHQIIYWYGITETITTDHGTVFTYEMCWPLLSGLALG